MQFKLMALMHDVVMLVMWSVGAHKLCRAAYHLHPELSFSPRNLDFLENQVFSRKPRNV